jgi:transposase
MYYIGLVVHKRTISYCGLCGAAKSSGNTTQQTPLSKQRNKHLQTTLIKHKPI